MEDLSRAQGGEGRHRCAICAFHGGFAKGKSIVARNPNEPTPQRIAEIDATITQERRAGFQVDPKLRSLIEKHAMKRAKKLLQQWECLSIDDTSLHECFDFTFQKNGTTHYVEVKGTQGDRSEVILTSGEVNHAKEHPKHSVFILVHSIQIKRGRRGRYVLAGGKIIVRKPWSIEDKDLAPTQFRWAVK